MTDLELGLRDVAAHLDFPPTPALLGGGRGALAVAFAVPASRASLLRFFHVRGATVSVIDGLPPLTSHRSLGQPIPLDTAAFRLLLPSGRRPESVQAADGGYWLRYPGLLLFEFQSGGGPEVLKKATLGKTKVEYVQVRGEPGIWIGGRHALYLPGGPPVAAGRALIWQHGPLTLRLEAAVDLERALAIAQSVR